MQATVTDRKGKQIEVGSAEYYTDKGFRHYQDGQIALGNECHREAARLRGANKPPSWREMLETPCPTCQVETGRSINPDGTECEGIVHPARA